MQLAHKLFWNHVDIKDDVNKKQYFQQLSSKGEHRRLTNKSENDLSQSTNVVKDKDTVPQETPSLGKCGFSEEVTLKLVPKLWSLVLACQGKQNSSRAMNEKGNCQSEGLNHCV